MINTELSHLLWTKLGDNRNQRRRSIPGQQPVYVAVCFMHSTTMILTLSLLRGSPLTSKIFWH